MCHISVRCRTLVIMNVNHREGKSELSKKSEQNNKAYDVNASLVSN